MNYKQNQNYSQEVINPKKTKFNIKRMGLLIGGIILLLGVSFTTYSLITKAPFISASSQSSKISRKIDIYKTYTYNLKTKEGNDAGQLVLNVTNAEKTDIVMVKGEAIKAPTGKIFLAINIEWDNKSSQSLNVDTINYFRYLSPEDKLYAPAFYNENVSVSPISVRNDKLAFVVLENQKDIKIQIGELRGTKEIVELKFNE
ncbi:MAG: hypothetical protein UR87_C0056G0007 [candidate division CPR3 bacterium GW2011_GWE2_35_7]|nr:MAG: hypothetical protein UR87_C0056G0007 [candidate division CPR3 bacterium GW2011_GWE2_35_7]